ncbi:hypothetical protein [Labrys neptuniae]
MTVSVRSASISQTSSVLKTASEVSLAKSESKLVRERTSQGATTRLTRFLKAAYPGKTIDNVAQDLGVARGTAKNWVEGKSTPGFFHMLKLIGKYGPEFLVAVYPKAPRWLDQAYRDHQETILANQMEALQRKREALR